MIHFIDDDEVLRELLSAILSDSGYEFIGFDCAERYLDYLNSPEFKKPVTVLSDVTMPGMNGYDLALKIREQFPFQKIALITGNADDSYHTRAAKQLCYTLEKPYIPEDLIALLASFSACENAYKPDRKSEYIQYCGFGIDHGCPFYISK